MKRLLLTAVMAIGIVATRAQYDIIPMPQRISMDAKGTVLNIDGQPQVTERLNKDIASAEGWRMTVGKRGILLEGRTEAGLFYGRQALRQVMATNPTSLPYAVVESAPRFSYRAMHLDVSRHFFGKEMVKQYLDMMALHAMNTLHFHLTDDQGWRIEMKRWPKLTTVGSVRNRTVIGRNAGIYEYTPHGGYFTQDDIREIVAYAQERHITIIPEIDMPGHMLAALAAYPELGCTGGPYEVCPDWGVFDDILCAGNDKVYRFLEDIIDELTELFPAPYIHLGGDEAPRVRWQQCNRCQQRMREQGLKTEAQLQGYMVRRMEQYLTKKPTGSMYFDYYQLPEDLWEKPFLIGGYVPLSKVYAFNPAPDSLSADVRRHIIGTQANVWTEYIPYKELLEYQVLPRMAALCEVQWTEPERKDYDGFLRRLPRLLTIYDAQGWKYCKKRDDGETLNVEH